MINPHPSESVEAGLAKEIRTSFKVQDRFLPIDHQDEQGRLAFRAGDLQAWLNGMQPDDLVYLHAPHIDQKPEELRCKLIGERLLVDWNAGTLSVDDDQPQRMPRVETKLLEALVRSYNAYTPNETLIQTVWGFDYDKATRGSLAVHVKRIRAKLGPLNEHLVTRRSFGYGLFEVVPTYQ